MKEYITKIAIQEQVNSKCHEIIIKLDGTN